MIRLMLPLALLVLFVGTASAQHIVVTRVVYTQPVHAAPLPYWSHQRPVAYCPPPMPVYHVQPVVVAPAPAWRPHKPPRGHRHHSRRAHRSMHVSYSSCR